MLRMKMPQFDFELRKLDKRLDMQLKVGGDAFSED